MDKLNPSTIHSVRLYIITRGYQVAYGKTVKKATLPMGNMTYIYDNGGGLEENNRIKSALEETIWLYNNLSYVRGINLDVHYGASTPTADCSYGGWMRVGPNYSYQQTGTILHEASHGVGVGTSNEWWSNIFREEWDRGRWLGPRTTEMIQFLNNDATAFMTGDNMHMWPISAFDCPHFGINGAFEDTTNPENTLLYFGNVMIVHAMHQDGLICSSQVGSISPAYVMNQGDSLKYYIKNESDLYGNTDSYVGIANGSLVNVKASMKNQVLDYSFAWYIGYNPITCMYTFKNVATNEYITNVSGTFKIGVDPGEIQVIPSRTEFTNGGLTKSTYWMVNSGMAMQGGDYLLSSSGYNKSNTAARQRWLFLSSSEATQYDEYCSTVEVRNLDELIAKVKSSTTIDHVSKDNSIDINEIDNELNNFIQTIEQ